MSLFSPAGTNYIVVQDLAAAVAWYIEKLSLRKIKIEMDNPEGCVALGFSPEESALVLGPPFEGPSDELTHMLYASKISKARDFLISRV